MSKVFPLGTTIQYADPKTGVVVSADSIELRDPTYAETDDFGPVFTEQGALDYKALKKWTARLSGLPNDAVRVLPNKVMYRVAKWISDECLPEDLVPKNSD